MLNRCPFLLLHNTSPSFHNSAILLITMANTSSVAEASLPNSFPTVPVELNGKNYHFWKGIMHPHLDTFDLLDYIEGRIPAPTETHKDGNGQIKSNQAYKHWKPHDKFALTCLMLFVTEEIGCNLLGAKTSHELWTTLATLFDSHSAVWEDFLE